MWICTHYIQWTHLLIWKEVNTTNPHQHSMETQETLTQVLPYNMAATLLDKCTEQIHVVLLVKFGNINDIITIFVVLQSHI